MEKVILTPSQIAKLLDISLDSVIFKITGKQAKIGQKYADYEKELKSIRKEYENKPYCIENLPEFKQSNSTSDDIKNICLLRLAIHQVNSFFDLFLIKLVKDKQCIEKIGFYGDFSHYEPIISEANKEKALKKLAEIHLFKYGKTKTHKDYESKMS